jgi:hypothetical protein
LSLLLRAAGGEPGQAQSSPTSIDCPIAPRAIRGRELPPARLIDRAFNFMQLTAGDIVRFSRQSKDALRPNKTDANGKANRGKRRNENTQFSPSATVTGGRLSILDCGDSKQKESEDSGSNISNPIHFHIS